jgi:hypothetical protein
VKPAPRQSPNGPRAATCRRIPAAAQTRHYRLDPVIHVAAGATTQGTRTPGPRAAFVAVAVSRLDANTPRKSSGQCQL